MTTKFNPSVLRPLGIKTPLLKLWPKNIKTLQALAEAHVQTIEDLLLVLPLRLQKIPPKAPFAQAQEGELFQGEGKIVNLQARPNFYGRGKRGVLLQNIRLTVQDAFSPSLMLLCWFNAYPSVVRKLKTVDRLVFWGKVSSFQGRVQIVNPVYQDATPQVAAAEKSTPANSAPSATPSFSSPEFKIQYPTINKIAPAQIQNLFKKLPQEVWAIVPDKLPAQVLKKRGLFSKQQSLQILHGLSAQADELWPKAMQSLVYEEFFLRQIKTILRKQYLQKVPAPRMVGNYKLDLPFALTPDQQRVLEEIQHDLVVGHPMMRLLQGDVGCGKTVVAFLAASKVLVSGWQVAVMCPTESLALQHFRSWQKLAQLAQDFPAELLLGS
ncbi:MAG: DEAD/DEAH box helicase, partial [Bacteriovoracaceae bacterium]|nr:DEAD/DEAH box helicase [Bacteriovoracaceae bacterium]